MLSEFEYVIVCLDSACVCGDFIQAEAKSGRKMELTHERDKQMRRWGERADGRGRGGGGRERIRIDGSTPN